jgi:hypothetical protein
VQTRERLALVLTHRGANDRLVGMPWLETDVGVDQSDWVVLSRDGWRAVADGDPAIWPALERRLLVGFYVSQPDLILVVGHESGDLGTDAEEGQNEVWRIVRRIRSLLLPAVTVGVCVNGDGTYRAVRGAGIRDSSESCATLDFEPAV